MVRSTKFGKLMQNRSLKYMAVKKINLKNKIADGHRLENRTITMMQNASCEYIVRRADF